MLLLNILILLATAYFVKQEYCLDRKGWLVFWSMLLGWDIHTLIGIL